VRRSLAVVATCILFGAAGYGLILRDQSTGAGNGLDQSGDYIVAEVNDAGQFAIWRRNIDRWAELQPWTSSSAVRPDASENDPAGRSVARAQPEAPRPLINPAAGQQTVAEAQQVRDLAAGLIDDVGSLMDTFSDGFDSPHSPVNDPIALKQASTRLEAATSKANQLVAELQTIRSGVTDNER
jgi:hypothetical protein